MGCFLLILYHIAAKTKKKRHTTQRPKELYKEAVEEAEAEVAKFFKGLEQHT